MNLGEINTLLGDLETSTRVVEWKVNNVRIWPFIRIELGMSLQMRGQRILVGNAKTSADLLLRSIRRLFREVVCYGKAQWLDRQQNGRLDTDSTALFLSYSDARNFLIEKHYCDVICDPIIKILERNYTSSAVIEYSPDSRYRIPRYLKSIFIQPYLTYARILSYINTVQLYKCDLPQYERVQQILKLQNISAYCIEKSSILRSADSIFRIAKIFGNWLKQTKTKVGFISNYGLYEAAFCLACKQNNIASVDIQHGVQGAMHIAYGNWLNVPREGYELRPKYFWCWNKESADNINKWSVGCNDRHHAFNCGNAWFKAWARTDNWIILQKSEHEFLRNILNNVKKNILVTLQPLQRFNSDIGLVDSVIYDVIKKAGKDFIFWIRIHPTEVFKLKMYLDLFSDNNIKNVNIVEATFLPLPGLLGCCDAHLTHSSSTVIEAAMLNVRSIVCSEIGSELFKMHIENKMCYFASQSNEVIALLNCLHKAKSNNCIGDETSIFLKTTFGL